MRTAHQWSTHALTSIADLRRNEASSFSWYSVAREILPEHFRSAMSAAAEEMRERCAVVADKHRTPIRGYASARAEIIAAAIRELKP